MKRGVHNAILRLATGPNFKSKPKHFVVILNNSRVDFYKARFEYFPSKKVTHLLIWTPTSVHMFDYNSIVSAYVENFCNVEEDLSCVFGGRSKIDWLP